MTGYTDYWARKIQDHSTGKTAIGSAPVVSVGLFTAVGTDAGTGFTEVSGGAYARVTTSGANWNASSGSAPAITSNLNDLVFPTASAGWGTILGLGGFDASSAGNLLWWDYLGNFTWLPFTCNLASPGVLVSPAHGFANADSVIVTAEYGGVLPTTGGSWAGTLTVAGVTTDTFNVGVNTTGSGNGSIRKISPVAVSSGQAPTLTGGTPGSLILSLA
jgi:hypothetical protein